MVETVSIKIERYRDNEGQPTCSIGINPNETCQVMMARNWGFTHVCGWTHTDLERRYVNGEQIGMLIPCDGCPVWKS